MTKRSAMARLLLLNIRCLSHRLKVKMEKVIVMLPMGLQMPLPLWPVWFGNDKQNVRTEVWVMSYSALVVKFLPSIRSSLVLELTLRKNRQKRQHFYSDCTEMALKASFPSKQVDSECTAVM